MNYMKDILGPADIYVYEEHVDCMLSFCCLCIILAEQHSTHSLLM